MKRVSLVLLLIVVGFASRAQSVRDLNLDDDRLALKGYDPVAYFKEKKPLKGKSSIKVEHEGVVYQFATQKNKDLFLGSPAAYKPQYGGWCAYAMGAEGEKVEVDPETFKIIDGRLYLFYNRFFNNTLDTWNKSEAELKTKADKNWDKLVKP